MSDIGFQTPSLIGCEGGYPLFVVNLALVCCDLYDRLTPMLNLRVIVVIFVRAKAGSYFSVVQCCHAWQLGSCRS